MKPVYAQITNPVLPVFGTGGQGGNLLAQMIANFLKLTFIIAGLILMAMIIWGGYDWMTAGGDKTKLEAARKRITNALVGFLIFMAVFALINYLLPALGIEWNILNIVWPTPD